MKAYLALGSNLGDSQSLLNQAIAKLDADDAIRVTAVSSYYLSKPQGEATQNDYVNQVIAIDTVLSPQQLLERCLAVEKHFGRTREVRWAARTLDIDIVSYEQCKVQSEVLTIPHPRAHTRDFVLLPLQEIAGAHYLLLNQPVSTWLENISEKYVYKRLPAVQSHDLADMAH